MFDKVLSAGDFTQQEDGTLTATIPAAEHGLAGSVYVERFLKATGGCEWYQHHSGVGRSFCRLCDCDLMRQVMEGR